MKITYKSWTFLFSQTESAKPTREQSLSCESISADTLTAVVRCNDPTIMAFAKNDPIRVWENDSDASMQTYYLRSITRTGATSYRLVAWSAVGLLAAMAHKGGIYTGQTVAEAVKEICGNVPVVVKSVFANTKLYGWLPYCQPKADRRGKSARDNLVQVLFAIGAYLTTDLNGVLHIDALWDGVSSTIGSNRMYASGGKVSYSDPISAVTVTEHQYIAGTDEKELFSGTSQQGDIITFSEPMHSLTATGFTILESGANYAKISSGSGSLKGKPYIHNTRLVTQTVTENAAENVKSVTDATLVSLVNSSAAAKRLADYYKCRETITNGIVSGQEKPGHVVSVYHPYDKKMVSACIVSLDTTMSGTLKSEMAALVGFLPPQPETTEYYDERIVLTGSGEWTVPEGVTSLRVVLVEHGADGLDGSSGASGGSVSLIVTDAEAKPGGTWSRQPGAGGAGGAGGEGGLGGRILSADLDVFSGTVFAYSADTTTTFGTLSAQNGSRSDAGFTDPVTGDVFGKKGNDGSAGGDGGGGGSANSSNFNPGENGTGVPPNTGGAGSEGNYKRFEESETVYKNGYLLVAGGTGGGGAAVGNNGQDAVQPLTSGVRAGAGANAAPPSGAVNYGCGGYGGNGGGGGGGASGLYLRHGAYMYDGTPSGTWLDLAGGSGGSGSTGGPGGDGCIIIYYRKKKELQSGWLKDKNGKPVLDRLGRRIIK
jgi:hypothetical protein|nr:MAG TPA: hypothetical protein [Caudoviricetes sp.]